MRSPLTFARDALRARWGQPGTVGVSIAQSLECRNLRFEVDGLEIVRGIDLQAPAGKVTCLLGPSGSGKTTLLRLLSGLERPTAGTVLIDGTPVADEAGFVPAEARDVGVIFQDYALFPHLDALANVSFGLRGEGSEQARRRAVSLLERVGLADRATAMPHELSGGEQQRVALARALAPRPGILVMDEPFSGLDARLRDAMRDGTLAMLRETRATSLIVTHDPDEALRMADHIALLRDGRLVQAGSGVDLYTHPVSRFAAAFFGEINSFPAVVRNGLAATPVGSFPTREADGTDVLVVVRANGFKVAGREEANFEGRVIEVGFGGEFEHGLVGVSGLERPLRLKLPARPDGSTSLVRGRPIRLAVEPARAFVFPDVTDQP